MYLMCILCEWLLLIHVICSYFSPEIALTGQITAPPVVNLSDVIPISLNTKGLEIGLSVIKTLIVKENPNV